MSVRAWRVHEQGPDVRTRYVDGEGRLFHRQFVQDVQPAVDANTRERNETNGWSADRSKRKIGSLPVTIVWDKIREWERKGLLPPPGSPLYGNTLNRLLVDMLRDRDYSKFRTTERV